MTKVNTFPNPFTSVTDNNGNKYDIVAWECNTSFDTLNTMEYTFKCRLAESPTLVAHLRRTINSQVTRITSLQDENQALRDRINNASEALEADDA